MPAFDMAYVQQKKPFDPRAVAFGRPEVMAGSAESFFLEAGRVHGGEIQRGLFLPLNLSLSEGLLGSISRKFHLPPPDDKISCAALDFGECESSFVQPKPFPNCRDRGGALRI